MIEATVEETAGKQKAQSAAVAIYDDVKDLTITDQASFDLAGEALKRIKGGRKQIDSVFRPILDRMNAAKKATMAEMRHYDDPLAEAETKVKGMIGAYVTEEERKRKEEEEKERKRLMKEAEEERLRKAEELEKAGKTEEAESVITAPVVAAPVPVAEKPKTAGVQTRENWKCRVTDLGLLVKAVADGKAPLTCIKADEVALGKMVRGMKGEMNYPGVEAYCETVVASGSR